MRFGRNTFNVSYLFLTSSSILPLYSPSIVNAVLLLTCHDLTNLLNPTIELTVHERLQASRDSPL